MADVGEVKVREGDGDVGRERTRARLFDKVRLRDGVDDRRVVRAGDRDDDILGDGSDVGAVRGGNRVGEGQDLAGGEVVEGVRTRIERPAKRLRGFGVGQRAVGDGEERLKGGVAEVKTRSDPAAGHGEGGRNRVGTIDVTEGKRAGGRAVSRVGLGDSTAVRASRRRDEGRRIVRTRDGDHEVLGPDDSRAVGDGECVGERDDLAEGEVVKGGGARREAEGDGAGAGTSNLGNRAWGDEGLQGRVIEGQAGGDTRGGDAGDGSRMAAIG